MQILALRELRLWEVTMKTLRFLVLSSISLFLLAACGAASSAGSGLTPCELDPKDVGQSLGVSGLLAFLDDSQSDVIYADLENDGCRVGIVVERVQFETWKHELQAGFGLDADLTVQGVLTEEGLPARPDEMQLILALSGPPIMHSPGSGGGLADVDGESCYCDCSDMVVGDTASVRGVVTRVETDAEAGVYAELETVEDCLHRLWVEERFWESWTQEERALFSSGEEIALEGLLTLVLGQLTIDIALPPMQ